mgnify:CR=1 FL=1
MEKDFYGLKVHEAALERGVKVVGATVHFVDEGTDTGPILLQKAVETQPDDTPEILQRRVMEQAEWKILPEAIDLIANGKVTVKERKNCDHTVEEETAMKVLIGRKRRKRTCDRSQRRKEQQGREDVLCTGKCRDCRACRMRTDWCDGI